MSSLLFTVSYVSTVSRPQFTLISDMWVVVLLDINTNIKLGLRGWLTSRDLLSNIQATQLCLCTESSPVKGCYCLMKMWSDVTWVDPDQSSTRWIIMASLRPAFTTFCFLLFCTSNLKLPISGSIPASRKDQVGWKSLNFPHNCLSLMNTRIVYQGLNSIDSIPDINYSLNTRYKFIKIKFYIIILFWRQKRDSAFAGLDKKSNHPHKINCCLQS